MLKDSWGKIEVFYSEINDEVEVLAQPHYDMKKVRRLRIPSHRVYEVCSKILELSKSPFMLVDKQALHRLIDECAEDDRDAESLLRELAGSNLLLK